MPDSLKGSQISSIVMTTLKELQKVKADITTDQALSFLLVSMRPEGVTIDDLINELGQTKSAASRNLKVLDHGSAPTALGLVDIMLDRENQRVKRRVLSPQGRELLVGIEKALGKLKIVK